MSRATTFILGGRTPTQRATVKCSFIFLPISTAHPSVQLYCVQLYSSDGFFNFG